VELIINCKGNPRDDYVLAESVAVHPSITDIEGSEFVQYALIEPMKRKLWEYRELE